MNILKMLVAGHNSFTSYSTEYTTPGTQTISIPAGASSVTVECIAAGAAANCQRVTVEDPYQAAGGAGGAYSKKNTYSVASLSGIYISVPAAAVAASGQDAFARENNSGGTEICVAKGATRSSSAGAVSQGGQAGSGVGDVKYSGGNGATGSNTQGGGGAAGPSGNGSNGTSGSGGASGGSPAGNGGSPGDNNGNNYGGGAGADDSPTTNANGAQGWIKLTWA